VGDFVFLSADPTLFSTGQAARFSHLKQKAELYLIEECPNLRPIIIRPGKVFVNTFYERFMEQLPLRKNYTSMDAVTAAIVDELADIYGEEGAKREGNEPLLIGHESLKSNKSKSKKASDEAKAGED